MHELQYLKSDLRARAERAPRSRPRCARCSSRSPARPTTRVPSRRACSEPRAFPRAARDARVMARLDRMAVRLFSPRSPASSTTRSRIVLPPRTRRAAAVLVPLLAVDDALHVLFTRRAAAPAASPGPGRLPGRRCDADDADAEARRCARRRRRSGCAPPTSGCSAGSTTSRRWRPASSSRPSSAWRRIPTRGGPARARSTRSSRCPSRDLVAPGAEREELWDFDGRQDSDPVLPGRGPGDLGRHASHHAQSARRAGAGGQARVARATRRSGDACTARRTRPRSSARRAGRRCSSSRSRPRLSVEGLGAAHRPRHAAARDGARPGQRARARRGAARARRRQRAARAGAPGVPAHGLFGSGVHEATLDAHARRQRPGSRGQGDARGLRGRPFAAVGAAARRRGSRSRSSST